MNFGEKQGDATAIGGHDVAMLVMESRGEPFGDQTPEVVPDWVRGVRRTEQGRDRGRICALVRPSAVQRKSQSALSTAVTRAA
jgi:hypothetical protein